MRNPAVGSFGPTASGACHEQKHRELVYTLYKNEYWKASSVCFEKQIHFL